MAKEAINPVQMADGSVEDFGKNGQIKREFVFTETGFGIKLKLITGRLVEVFVNRDNKAYDLLAARGAAEYISNNVAGVYSDKEGLHPEDFDLGIDTALEQLSNGELSTRAASEDLKGYGDLIRAMVEVRSTALNEDGSRKFSDEQAQYSTVKAVVLSSEKETNAARMRIPAFAALIEGYKLERQAAKKAKADQKAATSQEDISDLL